jgi:glycosyltransferase involved in cell wall biosynthesis
MRMKPAFSIVLPVHNQADHLEEVMARYRSVFLGKPWEIILVPNACRDHSLRLCRRIAARDRRIRVVENARGGWGLSVRMGLAVAGGTLVGYTNSARTDPEVIPPLLRMARDSQGALVKLSRHRRGQWTREWGSALYNLECRLLLGTALHDVNGTPKIFPKRFLKAMTLSSDGDLLDAELIAWCRHLRIPILELRHEGGGRFGGKSTTGFHSAYRMYRGVWELRKRLPW